LTDDEIETLRQLGIDSNNRQLENPSLVYGRVSEYKLYKELKGRAEQQS